MQRVETAGLYHYEVNGKREVEAAAALSDKLDSVYRDYRHNSEYILQEIMDARNDVEERFDVYIIAVAG